MEKRKQRELNLPSKSNDGDNEIQGLTPYELLRKPIFPQSEEEEVTISIKQLNTEFRCPVCLGILHDTHATMECLHRFCSECISKALRLSKKECPSCRVKCPSRRSLRSDTNFDAIIRKIYPNLEEYEAKEDERLLQISEIYNRGGLVTSLEEGIKRQLLAKKRAKKPRLNANRSPSSSADENDQSDNEAERSYRKFPSDFRHSDESFESPSQFMPPHSESRETRYPSRSTHFPRRDFPSSVFPPKSPPQKYREKDGLEEVELVLLVHSNEKVLGSLDRPFIKTTINCSVQHLCKYLDFKFCELGHESADYQITLSKRGRTLILPKYLTIADILKHYWKTRGDLILNYSLEATDLHE